MLQPHEKARLAWHCRRGMLELDLILQDVLNNKLEHFSPEQLKAFDALLSYTDPELYSWLMGHDVPLDNELKEIVALIRNQD